MLALLWCLVSPGAVLLLWREPDWRQGGGLLARIRLVRLEQWVALGLLVAHIWYLRQACRTMPPTEAEPEPEPNPESHLPGE